MLDLEGKSVEVIQTWSDDDAIQTLPLPPRHEYLVGLDLGQMSDFSALTVVRKLPASDADGMPLVNSRGNQVYAFEVPYLERFPLGTPYPRIIKAVVALMKRPEINRGSRGQWEIDPRIGALRHVVASSTVEADPILCIDATGVGRPCVDMFRDAGLDDAVAITITSGTAVTVREYGEWAVAKQHLVGSVQCVLQEGRLKVARGIPYADLMLKELMDFKVRITASANESWNSREGTHDDLVLSLCLPIWFATNGYYSAGCWV
jgi:hypothetical protein